MPNPIIFINQQSIWESNGNSKIQQNKIKQQLYQKRTSSINRSRDELAKKFTNMSKSEIIKTFELDVSKLTLSTNWSITETRDARVTRE
jgi:hypothetical protein